MDGEQGLRALVTRPREEAESLAAALARRAIEALIEPLIEIHYQAPEALDLGGVQAILCTSANGVRALARASGERGVPLFAVGDATAARARAEGFDRGRERRGRRRGSRPPGGGSAAPARRAGCCTSPANVVAGDLAGALRAQGFTVERRVLYEARPAAALSPAAVDSLRAGAIDFALFFSPRTAAIFARLAGIAGVAECCGTDHRAVDQPGCRCGARRTCRGATGASPSGRISQPCSMRSTVCSVEWRGIEQE